MSVKNCNLNLKTLLVCGTSLMVIFLLNGCGQINEPALSGTFKDCEEAQVLMTDLTVLEDQRQYMLPDGRLCPSHQLAKQKTLNDDIENDKEEIRNDKNK